MNYHRIGWLAALTLLSKPALAQSQWIVDWNGGGDFVDIQDAVDAASDGDLVIVRGGIYGGFNLTKSLTILGTPSERPDLFGPVTIAGVDRFDLSQLVFYGNVRVEAVPQRSRIQSCLSLGDTFEVVGVSELFLRDTEIYGERAWPNGGPGVQVSGASRLCLVESRIEGGDAFGLSSSIVDCDESQFATGGDACVVSQSSELVFADSILQGGQNIHCNGIDTGPGVEGRSLVLSEQSRVTWLDSRAGALSGELEVAPDCELIWSSIDQPNPDPSVAVTQDPPLPVLTLSGSSSPGGTLEVELHADAQSLGVLFIESDPAWIETTALFGADLWLAIDTGTMLVTLQPTGFGTPVEFSWQVPLSPPAIAVTTGCQAGVLDLEQLTWTASNPVEVLLDYY